jgi:hypothetical protein
MKTKLHHHHTTGFGMAMGLPINQAIDRIFASARELNAAAERTSEGQSFGQRLAQAVRRKQSPCVFAAAPRKNDDDDDENGDKDKDADNESFGKRIKKAIERKSRALKTQQQHKEQQERERSRYQQPQPRKHTKSD